MTRSSNILLKLDELYIKVRAKLIFEISRVSWWRLVNIGVFRDCLTWLKTGFAVRESSLRCPVWHKHHEKLILHDFLPKHDQVCLDFEADFSSSLSSCHFAPRGVSINHNRQLIDFVHLRRQRIQTTIELNLKLTEIGTHQCVTILNSSGNSLEQFPWDFQNSVLGLWFQVLEPNLALERDK